MRVHLLARLGPERGEATGKCPCCWGGTRGTARGLLALPPSRGVQSPPALPGMVTQPGPCHLGAATPNPNRWLCLSWNRHNQSLHRASTTPQWPNRVLHWPNCVLHWPNHVLYCCPMPSTRSIPAQYQLIPSVFWLLSSGPHFFPSQGSGFFR